MGLIPHPYSWIILINANRGYVHTWMGEQTSEADCSVAVWFIFYNGNKTFSVKYFSNLERRSKGRRVSMYLFLYLAVVNT